MPASRVVRKPSCIVYGPPRPENMPRGLSFHDSDLGAGDISVIETPDQFPSAHIEVRFLDLQPPQTILPKNMEWAAMGGTGHSPADPTIATFIIKQAMRELQ